MKEINIAPICLMCGQPYKVMEDNIECPHCNRFFPSVLHYVPENNLCSKCFSPMLIGIRNFKEEMISLCSNYACTDYFVYSEKFLSHIAYQNKYQFTYLSNGGWIGFDHYENRYLAVFLKRVLNEHKLNQKTTQHKGRKK